MDQSAAIATTLMRFSKYHALGNDYIVLNPAELLHTLSVSQIRRICHRNFGVGSDGILLGTGPTPDAGFSLRIFNPDGSEAEKSGNGLRIFARYLYDSGLVANSPFAIQTAGGIVRAQVECGGRSVTINMGKVSFDSRIIPVAGPPREVVNETMTVGGNEVTYCAATVGNPHCVVLNQQLSPPLACMLGPLIEREPRFPNRTNVQFLQVIDRQNIQIEIWERGAGYTLASGSSSSAAAAVANRLGFCDSSMDVHMPGGIIHIDIQSGFDISMRGQVTRVCDGEIAGEALLED